MMRKTNRLRQGLIDFESTLRDRKKPAGIPEPAFTSPFGRAALTLRRCSRALSLIGQVRIGVQLLLTQAQQMPAGCVDCPHAVKPDSLAHLSQLNSLFRLQHLKQSGLCQ